MALGFGLLAFGAYGVETGVKVSMMWLIFAYLFHTLGELCLSPVGLSYVSKLVPPRMIAFMFGMWYLAIAIGNKLAAVLGGQIEKHNRRVFAFCFLLNFHYCTYCSRDTGICTKSIAEETNARREIIVCKF